jgi:hypothetical protein
VIFSKISLSFLPPDLIRKVRYPGQLLERVDVDGGVLVHRVHLEVEERNQRLLHLRCKQITFSESGTRNCSMKGHRYRRTSSH